MTVSSSPATSLLVLLCIVIAGLCCMSFYLFRSVNARHKEQQDMTKAVSSAVELVLNLSEKGVPMINNKLTEVESRVHSAEQIVKRQEGKIREISEVEEALAEVQNAISGISTEKGPIQLSRTLTSTNPTTIYKDKGGVLMSDEERIKAARAARATSSTSKQ